MKLIIANVQVVENGPVVPVLFDRESKVGDSVFCASEGISNIDYPNGPYIEPRRVKSAGDNCEYCWIMVGEPIGTFDNFTEITLEEARKLEFNQLKLGYLDAKKV